MKRFAALAAILVLCSGCYTTTYHNFDARTEIDAVEPEDAVATRQRYWRHFWIYGWRPEVMTIDVAAECGGMEHVERLETGGTFLQGLVAMFAGYYINIYSPYTARVVCDHSE